MTAKLSPDDEQRIRDEVHDCELGNCALLLSELDALRAQLQEKKLQRDCLLAQRHMTIARLGGKVEDHPTSEINFLQRVDELREKESQLQSAVEVLEYYADGKSWTKAAQVLAKIQGEKSK